MASTFKNMVAQIGQRATLTHEVIHKNDNRGEPGRSGLVAEEQAGLRGSPGRRHIHRRHYTV